MNDNRDTPRRIKLAMAVEEVGNGNGHDARADTRSRPLSQADRIEQAVLEQADHLGNLARDVAILRIDYERENRLVRADQELHRGETRRIADAQVVMRSDLDGIARSVGAHRTFSGSIQVVTAPAPLPPTTLDSVRSPTGEHQVLTTDEYDRIVAEQDELKVALQAERFARQLADAKTKGAEEYALKLEADRAKADTAIAEAAKTKADRARTFREYVGLAVIVAGAVATAATWALVHFH